MKEFLKQRLLYEWILESGSKDSNEDKMRDLRKVLDFLYDEPWEERFQKDVFYQELMKRYQKEIKGKKYMRQSILMKAAVITIVFLTTVQTVCYAVTRKSIFHYLNQMKEWVTTIEFVAHPEKSKQNGEWIRNNNHWNRGI